MRSTLVVLLGLACVAATVAGPANTYSSQYDNVNIDEVLKNERLFQKYFKCLTDKGKCPPDAAALKRVLSEALKTNCQKCNSKQKGALKKVIKYLMENRPEAYAAIEKIYDPQGTYRKNYKS